MWIQGRTFKKEKKMKDKITPVLVGALVIFAFAAGSLWTKTKNLENTGEAGGEGKVGIEEEKPQQKQQAPEVPQLLDSGDQQEIVKNNEAVKGAEDAKVTIVEFSEYQCPFCKKYVDETYVKIMTEYGDRIRYIFRDYPLPFHQHGQATAQAARCAGEQGGYWKYHDKLFAEKDRWATQEDSTEILISFSRELGLDNISFRDCLTSGKYAQAIKDDFALGQKVGVSGTPTFFINGRKLVGAQPFEKFDDLIQKELNQ